MDYSVLLGTKEAGKVQVLQEGLYYRISCRVRLSGSLMYRLAAVSDGRRENLGILAPVGDGYGLDRKIPCKRFSLTDLSFLLVPSHEPVAGKFVPISPEEPFSYLERLKDVYLTRQQQRIGVIVPETENENLQ